MEGLDIPQDIPLGGFPAGDYRMETGFIDNRENETVTQDVLFSVAN